jgi:hypothetical protein
MSASGANPARRGLIFLAFVISVAIVIYVGIGSFVALSQRSGARPGTDGIRLFFLVAGFALLAGAFLAAPRSRDEAAPTSPLPPGAIRLRFFRALMLSCAGAIFGLVGTFITNRVELVLILGVGALVVNLLWALPQALRLLGEAEAPTTAGSA